ncbi:MULTISPECIES: DotU family type IV/VI secretion system protein [Variovorax]|jgi:type VI secretion system protein ImpK|uniref:DotU family type IV/VI secretion system protein n=1 Tax=Variovorax TaxID=34072 RepID=UPI00086F699F|nr:MULTISPECIES: DotU family type IV/VI secretion system protein [Variovorax]MBN8758439.1 DotU family type IV/VI secretion system protein [Variovorax sp.]ODU18910.1 MAG: type IV secretion protein DotU [Variovorax sp. SCN 67-85]ODV18613.1 MAG: type IV secretion protein DotU [Variovorax sp. SCN 67-20]OJZ05901.1 MAG: type IV secretion protein DotU [Variovorax sp. 67-131]UKI06077.1 DotU family type IV/VI secretion system protein [Variovorax paradoxus]
MARTLPDLAVDDHITKQFRAFYDEIVKARDRTAESRETDPDLVAQALARHLENLLELQSLESRRDSTRFELENVADARYLKAALADEILLQTPWVGRERWTAHLLETSLFRTNIAGDLVFNRIEELLSGREPSKRDIARLYLFALALGFQGKYRGNGDTARLLGYREELFQFVYQRPADFSGRDRVVSERAYASTLSHIAPRKLPTLSRWTVLFLLSAATLLAVSELLWLWQSWPVRQVLQPGAVDASGAWQR